MIDLLKIELLCEQVVVEVREQASSHWRGGNREYIFLIAARFYDGAVGLISIHLAFYQMNPWPTALRRILNLWKPLSSTPVEIFCFLAGISGTIILQLFFHAVTTNA